MGEKADRRARRHIVDCHGHVKWYGYDARRLVENMDEHGIGVMWLLTWEVSAEDVDTASHKRVFWPGRVGMPLEDVIEAVELYPDRFAAFYAPDPCRPGALERLRAAVEDHGVRGVGELKHRVMLDDPRALQMFHYCGEAGLPVTFHMDVPLPRHDLGCDLGRWYCCDWENLARALKLCPKTIFLGHGPGFWREISGDADSSPDSYPTGPVTPGGRLQKHLNACPNLYCDLSAGSALNALSRSPEVGREFLLEHQDRCLFGRDYFDDRLHRFIIGCELPRAAVDKTMGGNALRLAPL